MQSVTDMQITENDFLSAEQMREITSTPEELFQAQVTSIKENLMSSMVNVATKQGRKFYAAQFLKEGNDKLIKTISDEFEGMGYKINTADTIQENGTQQIPIVILTISWETEQ